MHADFRADPKTIWEATKRELLVSVTSYNSREYLCTSTEMVDHMKSVVIFVEIFSPCSSSNCSRKMKYFHHLLRPQKSNIFITSSSWHGDISWANSSAQCQDQILTPIVE